MFILRSESSHPTEGAQLAQQQQLQKCKITMLIVVSKQGVTHLMSESLACFTLLEHRELQSKGIRVIRSIFCRKLIVFHNQEPNNRLSIKGEISGALIINEPPALRIRWRLVWDNFSVERVRIDRKNPV